MTFITRQDMGGLSSAYASRIIQPRRGGPKRAERYRSLVHSWCTTGAQRPPWAAIAEQMCRTVESFESCY